MPRELIVPVDGSPTSFSAFDAAIPLARLLGIGIRLVEVAFAPRDVEFRTPQLASELGRRLDGTVDVEVTIEMPLTYSSVAAAIQQVHDHQSDSLIVMASHGRGRSAAVVGSVADDLLRCIADPIMLVGPKIEPNDFSGPVPAPFDYSTESGSALPIAAKWATILNTTPWIVNVTGKSTDIPGDVCETGHLALAAQELEQHFDHGVAFDQLYGDRPAMVVANAARDRKASVIVASTHGRSGLSLVTMGSVASGIVRHSSCPVLLMRPSDSTDSTTPDARRGNQR